MDLTIAVSEERPGYWARVVELPGCFASGRSLEELSTALEEALGLYRWDRAEGAIMFDKPVKLGESKILVMEIMP